jgi:integrase
MSRDGITTRRLSNGRLVYDVLVEGPRGPDGRRQQVRRRGFLSRPEARRARARLMLDVERGLADSRNPTLAAYLSDEWLPAVTKVSKRGRPLAPTTRKRYADAAARITSVIGKVRLAELRPRHVERLRDELLARGTLAPQTVGDVLRVLSQGLRKAVAKGWIDRNPADPDVVERPAGQRSPFTLITPELAQAILGAVRGTDPWDVAGHLALGVTLRREEVLGLRWSDVDLDGARLTVSRTLTFADGEIHEGPPKSEAGGRTIELPASW